MQSAVDSETGVICATSISQKSTDHNELPTIIQKTIANMKKPRKYKKKMKQHEKS